MPEDILEQPKVEEKINLDSVIKAEHDKLMGDDKEKKEPAEKKEPVKKETEEKLPEDLTEEEIILAKNMLKALKDPAQAEGVIAYLAKQGGYTKAEIKEVKETLKTGTSEEKAEVLDEVAELLSEQFGDEFAKKLSPAIQKAIEKGVELKTKDIKAAFDQEQLSKLEAESNNVLSDITKKFYGEEAEELPAEIVAEMDKLMDRYKPSSGQSMQEYLTDIYSMAAAKKGGSLKPFDSSKKERTEKNKNDIPGRMNSNRSPVPSSETTPTAKNLDEAIKMASETVKRQLDKDD